MPIIEGIGDEILQFLACIFIASLVIAAWFSTEVRDATSYRACLNCLVFLIHLLQRTSLDETSERSLESTATNNENINGDQQSSLDRSQTAQTDNDVFRRENSNSNITGTISTSQHNHEDTLIRQEATDHRPQLHIEESQTKEQKEFSGSTINDNVRPIKIKLKYLDDSIKIAECFLLESIGEFKRRSFSSELSQGSAVILLFNGRILDSDRQTLAAYGLFDDCVVHCLVRQRSRPTGGTSDYSRPQRHYRGRRRSRLEGSISIVMFPTLGMMLVGIWYSRYRYSELFSLTATVGLLVLSGLYIAALVGSCLPEEEPVMGLVPVM